jgi:hypothetical protein
MVESRNCGARKGGHCWTTADKLWLRCDIFYAVWAVTPMSNTSFHSSNPQLCLKLSMTIWICACVRARTLCVCLNRYSMSKSVSDVHITCACEINTASLRPLVLEVGMLPSEGYT